MVLKLLRKLNPPTLNALSAEQNVCLHCRRNTYNAFNRLFSTRTTFVRRKFGNTKYLNFPPDNQFFGDWRTKTNILDLHFLMRLLLGDTYYIKCILLNTSGSIMFYLSGKSEITSQIRVNTLHRIIVQYWSLHLRNGGVNF